MPRGRVGSFIGGAGDLNSVFKIGFSNMKPEAVVLARDLRFLSYCFKMGISVLNFRLRTTNLHGLTTTVAKEKKCSNAQSLQV